jgi:hypothetical protein
MGRRTSVRTGTLRGHDFAAFSYLIRAEAGVKQIDEGDLAHGDSAGVTRSSVVRETE